ncbi:MAG TPA: aldo/keto reductase [Caldilineaceae bacterium]|nr:aldo/keto reductase [Caldilineaceae bacterium]
MRYKLLGHSGLRVSELCLGTMTFGTEWGWGADEAICRQLFEEYVAAGGNFIDTANNYTNGASENIVGRLIADRREQFVVATKYTLRMANGNPANYNEGGNSRKSMRAAVEASLRRLNTDYIDLLYLHMWDFTTPVDEVMRGMDDLVRSGKVLYTGFSDTPSWVITYAIGLAERYGWPRPGATQLPYSLLDRGAERDLIPMARTFDLAVCAWGLLEGGALTGKYNQTSAEPKRYQDASPREKETAAVLLALTAELGYTPAQIAINWVRQQGVHIVPILGVRTAAQLHDNLAVLDFRLSAQQLAELERVSGFDLGFPLSFLTSDHVRGLIFGQSFAQIDNHRG